MEIRQEKPGEEAQVYEVVRAAFADEAFSDHDEQNLVNRLRLCTNFIPELSLVAEENNKIVGHILFTKIKVGGHELLALAPVAVLPERQGQRIGTMLIVEGHARAKELGYVGCVVMGHDRYYPKFGYQLARTFHITAPFEVADENFMAIELAPNGLNNVSGVVEYAKAFFE